MFGGADQKWIQKAIKNPGALHKTLGIPSDQTIPMGTLRKAAQLPGVTGKRARLAITLRGMKRGGMNGEPEDDNLEPAFIRRRTRREAIMEDARREQEDEQQAEQQTLVDTEFGNRAMTEANEREARRAMAREMIAQNTRMRANREAAISAAAEAAAEVYRTRLRRAREADLMRTAAIRRAAAGWGPAPINPQHLREVLTVRASLPPEEINQPSVSYYPDEATMMRFHQERADRLRAMGKEIQNPLTVFNVPPGLKPAMDTMWIEGRPIHNPYSVLVERRDSKGRLRKAWQLSYPREFQSGIPEDEITPQIGVPEIPDRIIRNRLETMRKEEESSRHFGQQRQREIRDKLENKFKKGKREILKKERQSRARPSQSTLRAALKSGVSGRLIDDDEF